MDRNNNDKNDCEEKNKIDITGCEIVTLASSISIFLCKKYSKDDLRKIKALLSSICTNISILEHDRDKFIK